MSTAFVQDQPSPHRSALAASSFLTELRQAHEFLIAAMEVMDRLTRQSNADPSCFANARWRISQASLARRTLWGAIFRHLLPRANLKDVVELERLATADREMLRYSANHISTWVPGRIDADWEGYCEASRAIRWRMKACLGAERRILYPLLDREAG